MTISEYLQAKEKPTLDSKIKERAVVENLRTSFFSNGYRPRSEYNKYSYYGSNEMDNFYRKTYLTLHQMESEAAKKWKEQNYVPVATSYYIEGLNKVSGTIFTGDNFTPSFYAEKEYKAINDSLGGWYEWLQSWLLPNMIGFPNDYIFFDFEGDKFTVTKIPFCEIEYVDSDIIAFTYLDTLIISDRFSTVKYSQSKGVVDTKQHNFESVLFMQLGGVMLGDIYSSFFHSFIAHAEQFARVNPQYYYELAKAFNMLVMSRNECRSCGGTGQVANAEYEPDCLDCSPVKKCPTCKGSSVVSVSPSDVLQVATQDFDKNVNTNIAAWVSPNIDTIQIKQDEDRFLRKEMKESLYIERSGVNQSGESKKMDNYAFLLFVRPIANRLHSLAQFVAERAYSFSKSVGVGYMPQVEVSVVEPIELDYLTADDLRVQMEIAKDDKDLYSKYKAQNYAKNFPSDSWLPFISEVRAYLDAYNNTSNADFMTLVKIGRVSENDYNIKTYFDKAVQTLIYNTENKLDFIPLGVAKFSDLVLTEIDKLKPTQVQTFDNNGNAI